MIINDKIKYKNEQYSIKREVAKIWGLSSVKIEKYEYLTDDEILPSDQNRIEPAKLKYSPLAKTFEKHIKTINIKEEKQNRSSKALKSEENTEDINLIEEIFPKDMRTNEIKNEIYEIAKYEEKIKQEDLKYKTKSCKYDFQ